VFVDLPLHELLPGRLEQAPQPPPHPQPSLKALQAPHLKSSPKVLNHLNLNSPPASTILAQAALRTKFGEIFFGREEGREELTGGVEWSRASPTFTGVAAPRDTRRPATHRARPAPQRASAAPARRYPAPPRTSATPPEPQNPERQHQSPTPHQRPAMHRRKPRMQRNTPPSTAPRNPPTSHSLELCPRNAENRTAATPRGATERTAVKNPGREEERRKIPGLHGTPKLHYLKLYTELVWQGNDVDGVPKLVVQGESGTEVTTTSSVPATSTITTKQH
jgi:hypothetical protein